MNAGQLHRLFREDTKDTGDPQRWTPFEVFSYMDDAYKTMVCEAGGVPDFTSSITRLRAVAGVPISPVDTRILRFMAAWSEVDNRPIRIVNHTDFSRMVFMDYGRAMPMTLSNRQGPIDMMVIGMQRGIVRWVDVPEEDMLVRLHVYRAPINDITCGDDEFVDLDERWHSALLDGMKALAYMKQDADVFHPGMAAQCEARFKEQCLKLKADFERAEHKTRVVSYGGL